MKDKKQKTDKKEEEPVKTLTPDERKRILTEGIKKTVVPAFIAAAFALLFIQTEDKLAGKPWLLVLLLVVLVSYYAQKLVYPYIGVKVSEFQTKDWMYVHFFVIIFLLVFWTLLLNIGTLNITPDPATLTVGLPENMVVSVTSNSVGIKGAAVYLSGAGVNMSNVTGTDSIAHFYNVNATSPGNVTATAKKTGYASGSVNITALE